MVFSDPAFLFVFLPFSFFVTFIFPAHLRYIPVFILSFVFYWWGGGAYLLVLVLTVALGWVGGMLAQNRLVFLLVIGGILLELLVFKYLDFLQLQFGLAPGIPHWGVERIVLPIGISFFVFQAISYVVDCRRRLIKPELNPLRFTAYLAFFPQLIAGPIVRYADVGAQFRTIRFRRDDFFCGAMRFCHGLGKKVLVADTLAVIADAAFAEDGGDLTFASAWIGAIAYALQIYYDFSGYSDMAIGLGRMFGIRFLENFDRPYSARSFTEFWRRWHISLSSWFRDYVYIPLGGNRKTAGRTFVNLLVVFILTGFWHGANWTFLAWGLVHGFFLILEKLTGLGVKPFKLQSLVFLPLLIGTWVIFRSMNLGDAMAHLSVMVDISRLDMDVNESMANAISPVTALCLIMAASLFILPKSRTLGRAIEEATTPFLQGAAMLYAGTVLLLSMAQISAAKYSPFLYFQF